MSMADEEQLKEPKYDKLYYSTSEVAEMLNLTPSLLRFWETEFPHLRPRVNKKGDRRYKKEDIEAIKQVYLLVKVKGYTLNGAKEALSTKGQSKQQQMVQRLTEVKDFLQEIKQMLLMKQADNELGAAKIDFEEEDAAPAPDSANDATEQGEE